jgi:hypothetical protein
MPLIFDEQGGEGGVEGTGVLEGGAGGPRGSDSFWGGVKSISDS